MELLLFCCAVLSCLLVSVSVAMPPHMQGPVFLQEPPPWLEFSNSTGAVLSCSAHGSPPPEVRWLDAADKELPHIPRLRELLSNGSLYFPPFPPEDYSSELHAATYRCRASNPVGSIVSRDCRIRADVIQAFQLQVHNVFVMRGNIAVLRCNVPSFVRGLVLVSTWLRDDPLLGRTAVHPGGRFTVTSAGALHVRDTVPDDADARYFCQTIHKLTGERRLSLPGQIFVAEPEANVQPRIEHSVPTVSVRAGNPADLVCAAQGSPPPTYTWYRDMDGSLQEVRAGSVLVRPLQSVLQFPRAQTEDAARYVCVASNALGEDRREIALSVVSPLAVHIRPQQQVVDAGSPASFNCSVHGGGGGGGGVHVTWLKDGRPLMEGPRVDMMHNREGLIVRAVRKEDRGMYQCLARSGDETAQGSAELTLGAVTPELQSTFIEQTLQPGPPVSLRCTASGNPPPRIIWLLDGGELLQRGYVLGSFLDAAGDVISHLNISSVRVQHGGLYTCVARNVLGAAQHSATLNIYGPPSARGPQNLTVVAGLDVYLRCPVAGFPISSVTWQRAGDILPSHLRHRVFTNGTLLVRKIEGTADRGEYTCAVTNQQGQSAQGRLHLDVMKPPQIASFQFPESLQEGMRIQISCSIISGDFPISITWRKDGGPLPPESDVQEQHHQFVSNLMFSNLAARHSGHYTCIASNAAAIANYTAKLTVRVAPTWVTEPQDISVLYQHAVALHCQAGGFPTPSITWMRAKGGQPNDFTPLESGHRLTISNNGSVLIRAADPTHEGHYTCQANNGIGSGLSKLIFLRVNVPAHFRERAVNQSGVAGERTVLSCAAEGNLPLRMTWSAAHRPLSPIHAPVTERQTAGGLTSEIHLDALSRRDVGLYRCTATNDFGQDEMIVYLAVKEPPESPSRVEVLEATSRWVRVTWGAPYSGHSPISHYVVQFREEENVFAGGGAGWNNVTVDGSVRTAKLIALRPATSYRLRLLAVNEVGAGPPSEPTLTQTLQEAPSAPPIDVSAEATSSEALVVRWKPPLLSYSNGEILGYQVGYRDQSAGPTAQPQTRTVRGRHRLEVALPALQHFTTYEITVRAFNQIGSGPASPLLLVTTMEGVPDKPPADLRCTALSPQSVRVRWDPPPPESRNGLIEGYKVVYKQVNTTQGNSPEIEVKKTTNLETNLHGLAKFANYSVRVLAFTSSGEGARSEPVHCMTEEDVPGAPELIKVHAMTSDSIMVAWTRPGEPNGNIIKYNVYIHAMQQHGSKDVQKESVFGDRELLYEVHRLKETQRYEFWVTASTIVGEGMISSKVSQVPTSRAPAKIASFSRRVVAGSGRTVILPCHSVGLPKPNRSWRGPSGLAIPASPAARQLRVLADGELSVGPVRVEDAGNYTCLVENMFGKDEITYGLVVQVPPGPPILLVPVATTRSLALQWRMTDNGGSQIIGYKLSYKREFGEWQEITIDSDRKTFTLEEVKCGSNYHLYITAINLVGTGKPSTSVSATTKGGAPRVPSVDELLVVNSTSVTLFLDAWPSGGCPMQYFVVEYRSRSQISWTLVSNNIRQEELVIPDLSPASWYAVRVTAHNDAGSSRQEFTFATKTRSGETILPEMILDVSDQEGSFYLRLNVIIPIISGVICTIAASICICIIIHRRHYAGYKQGDTGFGTKSLAELQNERNTDQQGGGAHVQAGQLYSPSPARKGDSALGAHKAGDTSGRQHIGQDYEICPYATFSLPGAAANTQTMDYSMQFQTFNQQDCYAGRPSTSGYGSKANNKDYYSRVRAKSNGSRSSAEMNGLSRTSKSPPDGLSLEISCISSQQTLPMSAAAASSSGGHHRRPTKSPSHLQKDVQSGSNSAAGFSRSRSCTIAADQVHSDSDSSEGEPSPRRAEAKPLPVQYRVPPNNQSRGSKTPQHETSVFEVDSSTESTEASPEVTNQRHRRGVGGRRGTPSR